ncbi:MAG: helix-turn-helix domain-containing protein [Treponema sp.]|nr:helix-turn-helix domain-containing protein [Treponema sp.]
MASGKKRIGLILASIHTGVSLNVWDSFVRTAPDENASLFIFPGGKLNAVQDFENLRNPVYHLVNNENLDGCISWSSTLRYNQSEDEFAHFHDSFGALPLVTLGFRLPSHPCVDFDAYNGMKTLVEHCIQVHGAKKIAFLRGPDYHQSAQARFEGYRDALREAGLVPGGTAFQSPLVSEPSAWDAGETAAAQLFETRRLIPGRDFDTLAASSDLMILAAANYLARHGFHTPGDYRAIGFNNSMESLLVESPLTTIHLPYAEMSGKSFRILLKIIDGKKQNPSDYILLRTETVLRGSCGCHKPSGVPDGVGGPVSDTPDYLQALRDRYENERCNTVLNSLKCDLLGTRDRGALVQHLARHLPQIGIHTAAIILYGDEKTSVFSGGFTRDGICPVKEQRFPARFLVPAALRSGFDEGIFLVQPLFIENRSLGYFITNVSINDGVIFEELRSSVSYALKGIFLLEETVRARKIAEQAERAKTEFLQALENGLFEPLDGIADRLDLMEKHNPSAEILNDIASLKKYVASRETETGSLMDFTLARLDELDLHKSIFDPEELLPGIGTFPLLSGDKARLSQCFSLIREFYSADYSAELSYSGLSITFRGIIPEGKARNDKSGRTEKSRQFNHGLSERIILMHGGSFFMYRDHCTVVLPWTTFTGQDAAKNTVSSQDAVLVLSDPAFLPANFFTLPQIYRAENAAQGKTAFITWNAAGANPEAMVNVSGIRHIGELAAVPFLCYGMPEGSGGSMTNAPSVSDAVEYALEAPLKVSVLFIGPNELWGKTIENFLPSAEYKLEKFHIDSMADFNKVVSEIHPLLIIFNRLDTAAAEAVRSHPLTVMVPILMIGEKIDSSRDLNKLSRYSRLLICHRSVIGSREFQERIRALIGGDEILPPHTGVLAKKAIFYFDKYAESRISRWKLADSVNVSEDYLTRIFHREMGIPLWDYLNRLRVSRAADLLQKTDETIQNIAVQSGFQDQAYFCRVFKKIYGIPPRQIRK